ncbi:MAG TPA: class I SAM-dependent methyltransferase, partial [Hyphomicrobiaceae bacterium]|nr:class I SAM-dependent methyltransferase [Hyphomicrobiaceae bacterium]
MDLLGDVRGRDILELGCGAGFYTRLVLSRGAGHVWAVDLSERMIAELPSEGVTGIHADATTANPGRSFDTLLSAGMLEFVPDPKAVLANAARFAAPNGRFAVLMPTASMLGRIYQRFHRRHGLSINLFDSSQLSRLGGETGWTLANWVQAGPYSAAALL